MLLRIPFVLAIISFCLGSSLSRAQENEQLIWQTIESENYTLYYGQDFMHDAIRTEDYLNRTIEAMTKEFASHGPTSILSKVECHVYLHPEPNEKASDGRSVCSTRGLEGGRRYAELHFLTPSRKSPNSRDSLGELKDENHFFRYIVHEYSSIWLGVIVRSKERGWYVNDQEGPNWFWQGYEEYLGMTLSSEHSRTVTFAKYMEFVKQDPDQVLVAYGYRDTTPRIVVEYDYTDGFALLAFMHDRFGKSAVQDLLTSERETFREAMADCFQMDATEFYEQYQQWLDAWKVP